MTPRPRIESALGFQAKRLPRKGAEAAEENGRLPRTFGNKADLQHGDPILVGDS